MKIIVAIILFLVGFKFMIWISPHLMPKTLNRPYSVEDRYLSSYANYWKGEVEHRSFKLRYNSIGNPMRAYRGEDKRCLFVGGSTYFSRQINQEDSFISQLDKKMEGVYIEPYIKEGLRDGQAYYVMEGLNARKKKYDCVIIGVQPSGKFETQPESTFAYWAQWTKYNERPLYHLVKKTEKAIQVSRYYDYFVERPATKSLAVKYYESRQEKKHLMKYYPTQPGAETFIEKSKRMKKVFESALKLSDNVYYIDQAIAYDENEHEDVHKRWLRTYINHLPNGEKVYFSNRAVAEERRYFNNLANQEAKRQGVNIIALDDFLRKKIQEGPEFFEDRWHLTVKGSHLASEFVSRRIHFP